MYVCDDVAASLGFPRLSSRWKGIFFLSYTRHRNSFLTNTKTHGNNKIDRENIIVEFSVHFFDAGSILFLTKRHNMRRTLHVK